MAVDNPQALEETTEQLNPGVGNEAATEPSAAEGMSFLYTAMTAPPTNINVFLEQEAVLKHGRRAEARARALMDIRMVNNPEATIQDTYTQAKADAVTGEWDTFIDREVEQYAAGVQQSMYEDVMLSTTNTEESVARSYEILQGIDDVTAHYKDVDGYEQALVDSYAPDSLPTERAKRNAVKNYAFRKVEELVGEQTTGDIAVDWATTLFQLDYGKDVSDLVDGIPQFSGDVWEEAILSLQSKTPDEQLLLIDAWVPAIVKEFEGNKVKVQGALSTIFNRIDPGSDIAWGTGLDFLVVPDLYSGYKAFKAIKALRAAKKVNKTADIAADYDAVRTAATAEVLTSGESILTREVSGTSVVDAAHSANPMSTRILDEGNSLDDIAGEIESVKKTARDTYIEELFDVAVKKQNRGATKALIKERAELQRAIKGLQAEKTAVTSVSVKGGHKVAQARRANVASLNKAIATHEERLVVVQDKITSNVAPAAAEAELSRMQQGVVTGKLQGRFDAAVEKHVRESVARATAKELLPADAKAAVKEAPATPAPVTAEVSDSAQGVRSQVNSILDNIIKVDPLSPAARSIAEDRATAALRQEMNEAGRAINSMQIVDRDAGGFTVKYTTAAGDDSRVVKFTKDDAGAQITEQAAGDFEPKWTANYSKIFSPEVITEDLYPKLVADVTFTQDQAAKIASRLQEVYKSTEKGLSKKENFQVNSVLQAGDKEETVFTIGRLSAGIETVGGHIELSPAQIKSYQEKRAFYDGLKDLRDHVIRNELEYQGFKNLSRTYKSKEGVEMSEDILARPVGHMDLAKMKEDDLIYFPEGYKGSPSHSVGYLRHNTAALKEQGYELVELFDPVRIGKKKQGAAFGMVRKDAGWSNLPRQVLNHAPGYIPRIYQKGYWYVRNQASSAEEVLFAFETKGDADKWTKAYNAEGGSASVYADGEFVGNARLLEDAKAYGGLYTGHRSSRPLRVKTADGDKPLERMSAGRATERYIDNISATLPLNDYRIAMMENFKNTANAFVEANHRKNPVVHFDDVLDVPDSVRPALENVRTYIKDVAGMEAPEERWTRNFMLKVADMMHGKEALKGMRGWMLEHSDGSITNWLKGGMFNLSMGWYNPRQLVVQTANGSIALSMYPKQAPGAIKDAFEFGILLAQGEKAGRAIGLSDEVIDSYKAYRQSGMREAVTRNADMDVPELGITQGSMSTYKKLAEGGRVMFREGENMARMISWGVARRNFQEANPGKALDVVSVTRDAQRMLMNMQSQNAAWWQRAPILNLAGQFLQVRAKFLENVMPQIVGGSKKWTAKEKRRAAIGQLVFFGTVDVPLASSLVGLAAMAVGETEQEFIEKNPNAVEAMQEGATGILAAQLGMDGLNASADINLWAGMDDNALGDIYRGLNAMWNGEYGETTAEQILMGPSSSKISKAGNVYDGLIATARNIYEVPTWDVAYGSIMNNIADIAAMTSTWSNAEIGWQLRQTGNLYSSSGKLIASEKNLGEMSLPEQLGRAMGIKLDKEVAYYAGKEWLKEEQVFRSRRIKQAKEVLQNYTKSGNQEHRDAQIAWLLRPFSDPGNIMDTIIKDVASPKTEVDKQINQGMREMLRNGGRIPTPILETMQKRENNDG